MNKNGELCIVRITAHFGTNEDMVQTTDHYNEDHEVGFEMSTIGAGAHFANGID